MKKIQVIHVTGSWTVGGTERMLMYSLPKYDPEKFDVKIVSLVEPTALTEMWRQVGIEVIHLNARRSALSLTAVVRLRKAINQLRPDIVFSFGQRAALATKLAKSTMRFPFVHICGQRDMGDIGSRWTPLVERMTWRWTDYFISNSEAAAEYLRKSIKVPSERVSTIPNGIDFDIPSNVEQRAEILRHEHDIPNDALVIGSVGRIMRIKGQEFLVRAMPGIIKAVPSALLLLVGEERSDGKVPELIRELGIESRTRLVGLSSEIAAWHRLMDVFVLPSLTEGMSVAAMEAMFSGLPIVATRVGGTPEVVEERRTGLLVPPGDPDSIADAVIQVLQNSRLRHDFSDAAKEKANRDFTLSNMVEQYSNRFREVIKDAA